MPACQLEQPCKYFGFYAKIKNFYLFNKLLERKNNDYYILGNAISHQCFISITSIAISGIPISTISRQCFVSIHPEKRQKTRGFQEV